MRLVNTRNPLNLRKIQYLPLKLRIFMNISINTANNADITLFVVNFV